MSEKEIPVTERLYYDDSYLRAFDAQVLCVREDDWAALDRSAFYPTSGGQPFDTGTLTGEGFQVQVTNVEVENGVVWHKTSGPLTVGAKVYGEIDWDRRWDHMQQHAGDHMLAGAAWQLFGGVTIGLHLGKEESTIDMDLPDGRTRLTQEETEALETLVNRRVQRDDPIRCWFPSPEELAVLPIRKRPTVTEHVRVVAMGDYEMVPCGGTHPNSTGQIGPIKILSSTPARGKMRLCFVAGMRAVAHYQRAALCADKMAAALSSNYEDAPEALAKEREGSLTQRKALSQALAQASMQVIRLSRRGNVFAAHLPFADHDALLHAASELIREEPAAVCLLSCPGKNGVMCVFARGEKSDVDMPVLFRACGGRGGGKPDLCQGTAPDETILERAKNSAGTP